MVGKVKKMVMKKDLKKCDLISTLNMRLGHDNKVFLQIE